MKNIDKGTRLANYLIDFLVIYVLWFIVILISQRYHFEYLILYIIMFLYYLIFEAATGKTLGKMVTKTRVVSKDGTKPNFLKILIRSASRIIPFDAFSYLFGSELGMHDLFSSTKLIKTDKADSVAIK
jgi:uncharacterized RDD family membrane protein YckC